MLNISLAGINKVITAQYPVATPLNGFISAEILKGIMPAIPADTAMALVPLFNYLLPQYKLNSVEVFPDFIAQCAEECASFTHFTENLNYTAQRLHAVFPSRFPTVEAALPYEHNPEKLANHIYANRMGNGNELSGDGWHYRGCGALMLTGKSMISAYAKYKGIDPVRMTDLLKADLSEILESAMWVFVVVKGLLDEAEKDDIISITKAINGDETGLASRKVFFDRARSLIVA